MDAAGTGALIGFSLILCAILTTVANEKGGACVTKCMERWANYKLQRQPLLPVTSQNPFLVRSNSKQFKMKEILSK